jgi:sulfite exporter TauE/SafE
MAKDSGYTKRVGNENIQASPTHAAYSQSLLFGKKNYMFILIGVGLIFLGLGLMSGGHMPSPDVWDESLIYSHRRITLAPIVILAGLAVNVYAIFVKK